MCVYANAYDRQRRGEGTIQDSTQISHMFSVASELRLKSHKVAGLCSYGAKRLALYFKRMHQHSTGSWDMGLQPFSTLLFTFCLLQVYLLSLLYPDYSLESHWSADEFFFCFLVRSTFSHTHNGHKVSASAISVRGGEGAWGTAAPERWTGQINFSGNH